LGVWSSQGSCIATNSDSDSDSKCQCPKSGYSCCSNKQYCCPNGWECSGDKCINTPGIASAVVIIGAVVIGCIAFCCYRKNKNRTKGAIKPMELQTQQENIQPVQQQQPSQEGNIQQPVMQFVATDQYGNPI
jgi:hypothetical protein